MSIGPFDFTEARVFARIKINDGQFFSASKTDLPPLQELTAYQKLEMPENSVVAGGLTFVMSNVQEIKIVAKSLF